jgi:hypothetical protein
MGGLFWLGLWLDWSLEPSVAVRLVLVVLVAGGLAAACYWVLLRRLAVPITDRNLALLLERHNPELGDHLATAVSLAEDDRRWREYNLQLVRQTDAASVAAVQQIDVGQLFDYRPLWRRVAGAAVVLLSIVLFAIVASDAFGTWLQRLALAEERWPRSTRLEVVGFERDDSGRRVATIARDDDFELTVRADLSGEHTAPERVAIRFRLPDGRRGRDYLTRVGRADPSRDAFQTYRYNFKNVRSDLVLDIRGGDDQVRGLKLRVVDRPELVSIAVDCAYPGYLNRPPQTLAATSGMRIPVGTSLVVRAGASKRLTEVVADSQLRDTSSTASYTNQPVGEVEFDYGQLIADDTLLIHLRDIDGIASRVPYRLSLSATPDELPQVAVNLQGIGTAVTPDARIPFAGEVTDDYGLRSVWFEIGIDKNEPRQMPLADDDRGNRPAGRTKFDDLGAIDLRTSATDGVPIAVKPGQQLSLAVAADDHCDLGETPRVGTSQRFLLDVVTPADLLLLVERRELGYRQRFEAIYEKVTDTRSMLARIDFSAPTETDEAVAKDAQQRALTLRRLRVAGAEQNVTQAADEVLSVAEGFDNLHDQLVNNRIENRELKDRLKQEIALPLHEISQTGMRDLRAQLKSVHDIIADDQAASTRIATAIAKTDKVLADMQQVLQRMLELETYNEVVALLRGIISDQDDLNERTKQQRQEGLRDLLED